MFLSQLYILPLLFKILKTGHFDAVRNFITFLSSSSHSNQTRLRAGDFVGLEITFNFLCVLNAVHFFTWFGGMLWKCLYEIGLRKGLPDCSKLCYNMFLISLFIFPPTLTK